MVLGIAGAEASITALSCVHKPTDAAVKKRAQLWAAFDVNPNLAECFASKRLKLAAYILGCYDLRPITVDKEAERQAGIPLANTVATEATNCDVGLASTTDLSAQAADGPLRARG